jgi:hypothetical protein
MERLWVEVVRDADYILARDDERERDLSLVGVGQRSLSHYDQPWLFQASTMMISLSSR